MFDLSQFLVHAGILCGAATVLLLTLGSYSPHAMLKDYPPAIQALVPPQTEREKRLGLWFGLPFLAILAGYPIYATFTFQAAGGSGFLSLFLYAFGLALAFNVWDWLVLDWLLFCTIRPKFMALPGTEGHPAYRDYAFHFRGFLKGIGFSALMGLIAAGIVMLLG